MRVASSLCIISIFVLGVAALLGVSIWGLVVFAGAREDSCCLPSSCSKVERFMQVGDVPQSSEFCSVPLGLSLQMGCRSAITAVTTSSDGSSGSSSCNTTSPLSCRTPSNSARGLAIAAALCGVVTGVGMLWAIKVRVVDNSWSVFWNVGFVAVACLVVCIIALNRKSLRAVVVDPAVDADTGESVRFAVCGSLSKTQPQRVEVTSPNFAAPLAAIALLSGLPLLVFVFAAGMCDCGNLFTTAHFWYVTRGGAPVVDPAALLSPTSSSSLNPAFHSRSSRRGKKSESPSAPITSLLVPPPKPISDFHKDYQDSLDEMSSRGTPSPANVMNNNSNSNTPDRTSRGGSNSNNNIIKTQQQQTASSASTSGMLPPMAPSNPLSSSSDAESSRHLMGIRGRALVMEQQQYGAAAGAAFPSGGTSSSSSTSRQQQAVAAGAPAAARLRVPSPMMGLHLMSSDCGTDNETPTAMETPIYAKANSIGQVVRVSPVPLMSRMDTTELLERSFSENDNSNNNTKGNQVAGADASLDTSDDDPLAATMEPPVLLVETAPPSRRASMQCLIPREVVEDDDSVSEREFSVDDL